MTPAARVKAIFDEAIGSDLSSWEKFEFLPNIMDRSKLSEKQEEALARIEKRLGIGEK